MELHVMTVLLVPGALAYFGSGVFLGDALYELKRGTAAKDVGLSWMVAIFLTALGLLLCFFAIYGGVVLSCITQTAIAVVVASCVISILGCIILGCIAGVKSNKASR